MDERAMIDEVASALSGEVGDDGATIVAELDGVEVTATVVPEGATIRAPAVGAGDLSLRFYPEGFAQAVGKDSDCPMDHALLPRTETIAKHLFGGIWGMKAESDGVAFYAYSPTGG